MTFGWDSRLGTLLNCRFNSFEEITLYFGYFYSYSTLSSPPIEASVSIRAAGPLGVF